MIRKIFPVLGAICLGSCSYFSPDYHKPDVNLPATWSAQSANFESVTESLPYLAWWQKFQDADLNQFIESGLKNNANIALAKANIEAAQGQLLTVKLNWLPFVSLFGGTINGSSQNSIAPIGNLGAIANSGSFFAILPAYTLNVFTNYTLQKQANYNLDAAKNAELSVRLAVIGQVAAAYFTNLAQQRLVEQFTQLNNDAGELVKTATALDNKGLANSISLQELQSKQQLIEGQLALAKKNLAAAQNALRYLLNQPPGKIKNTNQFVNINPDQIIPGNLPVSVIAARPDVLKAEAQLKAANEGISVASSALLPSVNLNYFYAQGSGQQTFNNPISGVGVDNGNQQSYYAAYANWTISPSIFGQIDTNTALFKTALANYKYVVNTVLHEVDNALVANQAVSQKMVSDNQAYKLLQQSIITKQEMLKRGLTTSMLVTSAKIEQDILAIDLTQTKLQQLISLVNLYQSLGGGYNYNESMITNK